MQYSEAEIDEVLNEPEPLQLAPRKKRPFRKAVMVAGAAIVVLGGVAFAILSKPAQPPRERMWYEAKAEIGGSVPVLQVSPGVGQMVPRDTGTVLDTKVVTENPADAVTRLTAMAATLKPRGGQRYTVALTVTANP